MTYRFILAFLCLSAQLFAQEIPVGTWRTHLTYHNAQNVAVAGDKIYCASENGLFYLDKADNSLQTITTIDGLSDIGIADLAYATAQSTLVIGYQNGNIDLIREDERSALCSILAEPIRASIQFRFWGISPFSPPILVVWN
jgi:hypothetical protein